MPNRRTVRLAGIRLEKFKAFKDSKMIQLKPLSILVGKNSAGKSSIIKAILACAQTSSTPENAAGLDLIGDLTNLGTFSDTIHGGDLSDNFSITFEIPPPSDDYEHNFSFTYKYSSSDSSPLDAIFSGVKASYGGRTICRGSRFEKGRKTSGPGWRVVEAKFNELDIFGAESEEQKGEVPEFIRDLRASWDEVIKKHHGSDAAEVIGSNYHLFLSDFKIHIQPKVTFGPTLNEGKEYPYFGPTAGASGFLNHQLARTIYLGPLRDEPSREARLAQSSANRVGIRGEDLAIMLHVRRENTEFMEKFNSHLSALGIAESATTTASYTKSGDGKELETGFIKVMVNKEGTERSLMDLGFGTSQVLPIVFELTLRKNRLIVLEQPELHLHPAAQAELGDLLKFSLEQGNQIIAETHSANLIERIRKLIRNGELSSDDANIIYIRQDSNGAAICDSIGFNDDGTFSDTWPEDDFFGEREKEIFDW